MSIESISTTTYMIAVFLFVATLISITALFVLAIASICRINQNNNPDLILNNFQLYIRSWTLTAIYSYAAYFGYGLYSLLGILVLAKISFKMTFWQSLLFTLVAGLLWICLNIVLVLLIYNLGGGFVINRQL